MSWADLLDELELNDWHDPALAPAKIAMLARLVDAGRLGEADRSPIRNASTDAWGHLVTSNLALLKKAKIVCSRGPRLVAVGANAGEAGEASATIYVAHTRGRFETRLLAELDQVLLEVEEPAKVVAKLHQAGFEARLAEDAEIKVMIGDESFVPSADSSRLLDDGRAWLGDLSILALDAEGRGLAAQISRPKFRNALAKVRLVFAESARVSTGSLRMIAPCVRTSTA